MTVFTVDEDTNASHTFTILDEDGNPIQPTVLTLTYYDQATGAIINSRDGQDVLNQNDVTVTNGVVLWLLQQDDTAIISPALEAEIHVALWRWTANGKANHHETLLRVPNTENVP
jgi:hypothetical protein